MPRYVVQASWPASFRRGVAAFRNLISPGSSSPRCDADGDVFGPTARPALLADAALEVALIVGSAGSRCHVHGGVLGARGIICSGRGIVHALVAARRHLPGSRKRGEQ